MSIHPKNQSLQPPELVQYSYVQEDEISLNDLWKVLAEYKSLIIAIIAISTTISVAIALLMAPV
mgnify:FL=1